MTQPRVAVIIVDGQISDVISDLDLDFLVLDADNAAVYAADGSVVTLRFADNDREADFNGEYGVLGLLTQVQPRLLDHIWQQADRIYQDR